MIVFNHVERCYLAKNDIILFERLILRVKSRKDGGFGEYFIVFSEEKPWRYSQA